MPAIKYYEDIEDILQPLNLNEQNEYSNYVGKWQQNTFRIRWLWLEFASLYQELKHLLLLWLWGRLECTAYIGNILAKHLNKPN